MIQRDKKGRFFKGMESNRKIDLPNNKIKKLYLEEKKSPKEISEIFGCSITPIYRILEEFGIKRNYPWNKGLKATENSKVRKNVEILNKKRKQLFEEGIMKHPRGMLGKKNKWGKHTEESKLKIKKRLKEVFPNGQPSNSGRFDKGEKNPNFNNWSSLEPYDNKFNQEFKDKIRKRDNFTCIKCDKPEYKELQEIKRKLTVHHIDANKKLTIKENCCTLCTKCNIEVNYKRQHWKKFFQSLLEEKYNYQYSQEGEIILNM